MKKTILIMGAPGTGKGTFAQMLVEDLNVCHIATGDIFRENIKEKTPVGIEAIKFIEQGLLVPDSITDEMLRLRLQKKDIANNIILLDGYPRNIAQGQKVIELLNNIGREVELVLWLTTPEDIITNRIINRRLCKDCDQVHNVSNASCNKPKIEGKCNKCGGTLYQRQDDNIEFITNRLNEYKNSTLPLIDFYKNKVSIFQLDTSQNSRIENYEKIKEALVK